MKLVFTHTLYAIPYPNHHFSEGFKYKVHLHELIIENTLTVWYSVSLFGQGLLLVIFSTMGVWKKHAACFFKRDCRPIYTTFHYY